MQQNVPGIVPTAAPVGSPPLGWQVPGMYVAGLVALLPGAAPAGRSWQTRAALVTVARSRGEEQPGSLKTETSAEHELPDGAPHVQGAQPRVSSIVLS